MFNIVDGGRKGAFADRNDAAFHIFRRQAAVAPNDGDDRNVDVRVDVLRRFNAGANAQQHHQQRQDNEVLRTPQRQSYNPHLLSVSIRKHELDWQDQKFNARQVCQFQIRETEMEPLASELRFGH
jgi:hypothetical protein